MRPQECPSGLLVVTLTRAHAPATPLPLPSAKRSGSADRFVVRIEVALWCSLCSRGRLSMCAAAEAFAPPDEDVLCL